MSNVIEVSGLVKTFRSTSGWFSGKKQQVEAVKGVSFQLAEGETLAVVGESGSGKSTLARMLVGLERPTSGTVILMGEEMSAHSKRGDKAFGQMIQYVFQDPVASLNPRKTIAETLEVPLRYLCDYPADRRKMRMRELMDAVQMPADALTGYPHEFSGGQAQRLAIARALAAEARILVLDEPVSALDVSVQAQVLNLMADLRDAHGVTFLFISHDLAVVSHLCADVAVMKGGLVVEHGPVRQVLSAPQHAYTRTLLASVPELVPLPAR